MERSGPAGDPRLSHDDPLLDGLLILCKLHDCPASRASLTAGLPLPEQRLSAELLPRAAARAGLQGRLLRRELMAISPLNLPVLLLLKNGRSAVLRKWGPKQQALLLPSESDGGEQWVSLEQLTAEYSGQALFARPRHELDETRSPLVPRVNAWFRDTLRLSRGLYGDALLASLLVNLLGLMVPLFVMQTYDRVVPNQALSTLWVLAIGLFVGTSFELLLRVLRAHLLDTAGKKTDVVL
ncbi:MAG: type I secretion system permease/ATPase, partial [Pseudomonas sp.]